MLLSSPSTTTAVIHAYSVKSDLFQRNKDFYLDRLAMSGMIHQDVVKYELAIKITNTDCYVAPSYTEQEYYTYWAKSCTRSFD
jgi:hypothetical protein